jgi:hypothetical protein
MSAFIHIAGYSDKNNPEFQKHLKAVKFCIENDLSYPKETDEFFKGKIQGGDLNDTTYGHVLSYIENGIEVDLSNNIEEIGCEQYRIKLSGIPKEVDEIIVELI